MFADDVSAYAYAGQNAETEPETTDAPTTEAPTDVPATEATTDAPTTDSPANDSTTETDIPDKSGCGSVIGMGTVAVLTAATVAVALKKKK